MKKLLALLLILLLLPVGVFADVIYIPYPQEPEIPEYISAIDTETDEPEEVPAAETEEAQTPPEAETVAETEPAGQNTAPDTRDYTAPIVAAAVAVAAIAAAVLIYTIRTKKSKEA